MYEDTLKYLKTKKLFVRQIRNFNACGIGTGVHSDWLTGCFWKAKGDGTFNSSSKGEVTKNCFTIECFSSSKKYYIY